MRNQMGRYMVGVAGIAAALLMVFMVGCGQEIVTTPTVMSATPAQAATNVAVNATMSATFSTAMDPTTIRPQPLR